MGTILENLGIYGFEEDKEDAVLASLLTGDPTLLIGKQGTAKTALVEAIGYALNQASLRRKQKDPNVKEFTFRIYDASKINFEDLIGFPNPQKMMQGEMGFIASPMTVWGADMVCFDEFNRQDPARQNNIFEIIRSRRLMGQPTGTTWVFNCMNPFGMAGTEELDDAIVDRHQFFVHVASFTDLSEKSQQKVVHHAGNSDAIGIKMWTGVQEAFDIKEGQINQKFADAGDLISKVMIKAGEHYNTLKKEVGDSYASFVGKYFNTLTSEMANKDWKIELSGRRAGMIYRALLAYRAVDLAKCEFFPRRSPRPLKDMFKTVFKMTIPIGIANAGSGGVSGQAAVSIASNVDLFSAFFNSGGKSKAAIDVIYELLTTRNLERKIDLLINEVDDDIAKNQVWSDIIKGTKDLKTPEGLRNAMTIGLVANLMTVKPEIVPKNIQSLIAKESLATLGLKDMADSINLKGQLAFYHEEIDLAVNSYTNSYVKLQAKLLLEQHCEENKMGDINKREFARIMDEVKQQCASLERMLVKRDIK